MGGNAKNFDLIYRSSRDGLSKDKIVEHGWVKGHSGLLTIVSNPDKTQVAGIYTHKPWRP